MDNYDIFNYRACERCHAQKLKCRPQTDGKCIRCAKANILCVQRPLLRTRKSENAPKRRCSNGNRMQRVASQEPGLDVDMGDGIAKSHGDAQTRPMPPSLLPWSPGIDLSNLDFSNFAANTNMNPESSSSVETFPDTAVESNCDFIFDTLDYSSMLGLSSKEIFPSSEVSTSPTEAVFMTPNSESTFSKVDWVENLTRLNSRVTQHNEAMAAGMEIQGSTSASSDFVSPSVEDTLELTTDLIKLLDQLVSHTADSTQNETQSFDESVLHSPFKLTSIDGSLRHFGSISPGDEERRRQSPIHGDQFTIMLLISCYMRLLGIYELLFTHIHTVLCEFKSATDLLQSKVQLPAITVGSFSLHSSPGLETLLIIELVTFLIGHIGHTIELMAPTTTSRNGLHSFSSSSKSSSAMAGVLGSMHNAVREKEKELIEAMDHTRRILMRSHQGTSVRKDLSACF